MSSPCPSHLTSPSGFPIAKVKVSPCPHFVWLVDGSQDVHNFMPLGPLSHLRKKIIHLEFSKSFQGSGFHGTVSSLGIKGPLPYPSLCSDKLNLWPWFCPLPSVTCFNPVAVFLFFISVATYGFRSDIQQERKRVLAEPRLVLARCLGGSGS